VIFDPAQYKERSALLLTGGIVYLSLGVALRHPPLYRLDHGLQPHHLAQVSVLISLPRQTKVPSGARVRGWPPTAPATIFLLDANGVFDETLIPVDSPAAQDTGNASSS